MQLFIRHGSSLWFRNNVWYVATQGVLEPLLRRPALKGIGIDTIDALEAARIVNRGEVDVGRLIEWPNDMPHGRLARGMTDQGLFHHSGSALDTMNDSEP